MINLFFLNLKILIYSRTYLKPIPLAQKLSLIRITSMQHSLCSKKQNHKPSGRNVRMSETKWE